MFCSYDHILSMLRWTLDPFFPPSTNKNGKMWSRDETNCCYVSVYNASAVAKNPVPGNRQIVCKAYFFLKPDESKWFQL